MITLSGQLTLLLSHCSNEQSCSLSQYHLATELLQVMNCYVTEESGRPTASKADEASGTADQVRETHRCSSCNGQARPVARKSVLLMLKPELLERAMHGNDSFCSARDCSTVYFEDESGEQFTVNDLRIRVGLKVKNDPIPLCYCFGFDESHIRDEIARTGSTIIPDRVSRLIREGLCACESRNPSGACCLGEVKQTMKRIIGKE